MKVKKIISGGQTGVDQAALQAAIDSGIDHGGWYPPGRRCESGFIPDHFDLMETPDERDPSASHIPRSQRTIWNVRDSDGLLIFWVGEEPELQSDRGTKLAMESAKKLHKPYLIVDPESVDPDQIRQWITKNEINVLSIGGPGEKHSPGIYDQVYEVIKELIR